MSINNNILLILVIFFNYQQIYNILLNLYKHSLSSFFAFNALILKIAGNKEIIIGYYNFME